MNSQDLLYLRYNSFVSNRFKFHYISTPKVACTSTIEWIARLEGVDISEFDCRRSWETTPDLVIHDSLHRVAPNITGLSEEDVLRVLSADEFFRFAMVRNPFRRIFSSWQSKIMLREPLQIEPYKLQPFYFSELTSAADIANAFEEFLVYLKEKEWPHITDPHWTPQFDVLRIGKVSYSMVSHIESSSELWHSIEAQIKQYGGEMPTRHRFNEGLLPYSANFITDVSATLIRDMYAADFNEFAYSMDIPSGEEVSPNQLEIAFRAMEMVRGRNKRFNEVRWLLEEQMNNVHQLNAELDTAMTKLDATAEQLQSTNNQLESANNQIDVANQQLHKVVREQENNLCWKLQKYLRRIVHREAAS